MTANFSFDANFPCFLLGQERTERLEMWKAKARANGTGTPIKPNRHKQQAHYNAELFDMDEDDIAKEGYILNKARQEDEEAVRIAPSISHVLRPHQVCSTVQIEHFLV